MFRAWNSKLSTEQFKAIGQNLANRAGVLLTDRRLPVVVMVLGLLLLSHSLASLTWKLVPLPELVDDVMTVQPRANAIDSQPVRDQPVAGLISQWHLFGEFIKQKPVPPPVQQAVETAPDTRLSLKLLGVFSSTNQATARAIIADAKGEDSFKIGDQLPGGAVLNSIFDDRVVLDHEGSLETLRLPVDIPTAAELGNGRNAPVSARGAPSPPPQSPTSVASLEAGPKLRELRDKLVSDPQSVMGLVRAEPFRKNGKLSGYRIRPGNDRQILTQFGLQSGDVVTAVNGVPMDNPLKALELMRDLSAATSLTLDIERRGVSQSLSFAIP